MSITAPPREKTALLAENAFLRAKLEEAEDMLRAIRRGEVDALVMETEAGPRIYSLEGVDAASNRARGEMLAQISDAVIAVDTENRITFINAAARRQYAAGSSLVLGQPIDEFLQTQWPDPSVKAEALQALGDRDEWRGELHHLSQDGRALIVDASITRLRDADGQPIGLITVLRDIGERKRAEQALQESEAFNIRLFEASPDCVKIIDADGRLERMNLNGQSGMEIDDFAGLRGTRWVDLWPPETRPQVTAAIAKAKAGEVGRFTGFCPTAKGTPKWWDVMVTAVPPGDSTLVAASRDVTAERAAQEALRRSEERVRLATEAGGIGIWMWTPATDDIVWENAWLHRLLGIPETEPPVSAAQFEAEFVHPDDRARFVEVFGSGPRDRYAFEGRFRRRDGALRWIEFKATAMPGEPFRLLGTARDVTERRRAEEDLRESEAQLRLSLEAAEAGIWSWNLSTNQLHWSSEAFVLFGRDPALGQPDYKAWEKLVHPDDLARALQEVQDAVEGRVPHFRSEFRIVAHDGSVRWLLGLGRVERAPDGAPLRLSGINLDITERKKRDEHIQLLLREVSHRSKNMLAVVQAMAKQTAAKSPQDFVERFGQRVLALAASHDLLVRSDWRSVSLEDLVGSQLAHFGGVNDARVSVSGPALEVTAVASQTLGMALHELATNAAKYGALTSPSGRLDISWDVHLNDGGEPRFVMSWIEHGGPEVSPPTRRGFGSTVIDAMVRVSLNCSVVIDYAPSGFSWRIEGPADRLLDAKHLHRIKQQRAAADPRQHVLVVEDEPLLAMEMAAILADAGYTVMGPALTVGQALTLLEGGGCDAAVLDTNLGAETVEPVALRLNASATPFITVSGTPREHQPAALQIAPLLGKPVRPGALVAAIKRCLARV
jgi:PAS domain S-box-containing protein